MNLFQDEMKNEFERIKKDIESNKPLVIDDLKIIFLAEVLGEEDHEV